MITNQHAHLPLVVKLSLADTMYWDRATFESRKELWGISESIVFMDESTKEELGQFNLVYSPNMDEWVLREGHQICFMESDKSICLRFAKIWAIEQES